MQLEYARCGSQIYNKAWGVSDTYIKKSNLDVMKRNIIMLKTLHNASIPLKTVY
jgi:hypothetical protein